MGFLGRVISFVRETWRELVKVSWPTAAELKTGAVVVLTGAVLVGMFVAIVDFSLFQVVSLLLDFSH